MQHAEHTKSPKARLAVIGAGLVGKKHIVHLSVRARFAVLYVLLTRMKVHVAWPSSWR